MTKIQNVRYIIYLEIIVSRVVSTMEYGILYSLRPGICTVTLPIEDLEDTQGDVK